MRKKHIPFPTVFIFQIFLLFLLALISFEFCMALIANKRNPVTIIVLISSVALMTINVLSLILSLTIGWNVPITINVDGIYRKRKIYHWGEAVSVSLKSIIRTFYGPLIGSQISIQYSNGRSIRLELSPELMNDIIKICGNKQFLMMLEEAVQKRR